MHFRAFSRPYAFIAAIALALTLGSAGCKKAASPPSDEAMTAALHSRLAGDGALSAEPIQSSVKDGIATLDGAVSSDAARSLAAADAAQVSGIRTVVNNLVVQQPAPVAAATPPPAIVPSEPRKPAPLKAKPRPVERKAAPASKPIEQAEAVPPPPPPPPQERQPAPIERPSPPPRPAFRNVTIPSGAIIPVRITQTLDSATTQLGDKFSGTLASDVVVDGVTAIPQGTPITGRVSDVQEAAHYKGSSLLSIQLTGINRRGERLTVTSEPYTVQGKGRGKNTAEKVGGGAAIGAILGGIFGGGKGAAIGAAAGGGAGAGVNTITKGEQVQIPSESVVRFHLSNPLALRVSTGNVTDTGDNESAAPNPELQRRPSDQPPQ